MAKLIPTGVAVPLRHMDALDVLRKRIPELEARDAGKASTYSARRLTRLPAGLVVPLAALASPDHPRLMVVQAHAIGNTALPAPGCVDFVLTWALGDAEGYPIRFYQSGPFAIVATMAALAVENPGGTDLTTGVIIHGSIALDVPPPGPARPLWLNPANIKQIAGAGAATFQLHPLTRRIRVGRANPATNFTVNNGAEVWLGQPPDAQAVPANGDFGWRESVGQMVQVVNNAAGADTFTVQEELGL